MLGGRDQFSDPVVGPRRKRVKNEKTFGFMTVLNLPDQCEMMAQSVGRLGT